AYSAARFRAKKIKGMLLVICIAHVKLLALGVFWTAAAVVYSCLGRTLRLSATCWQVLEREPARSASLMPKSSKRGSRRASTPRHRSVSPLSWLVVAVSVERIGWTMMRFGMMRRSRSDRSSTIM
ncbi:unnamed protein product, partial [Trichogramma brassicae]